MSENVGRYRSRVLRAVKDRTSDKGKELLRRAAELYDTSSPQVSSVAPEPIIYEYDRSNRSGIDRYKSSYCFRGERVRKGKPFYRWYYVFPLPVLSEESSPHFLDLGNKPLLPDEEPVGRFFRYVSTHMNEQIPEMTLNTNVLDVRLMYSADVEWRRQRPDVFYQQLGRLMAAVHPDFPLCTVERVEPPNDMLII